MKIGVLIIGSLYWDTSGHRDEWRSTHLECNDTHHINVLLPICYGRRSKSRGCSYTMVFSTGLSEDQFGCGIVVPCKSQELIKQAEYLWAAERGSSRSNGRISDNWGCIALLVNPDYPKSGELCDYWTRRVTSEPCYGQFMNSAISEEVAVDKTGFLNIRWPKSEDGSNLELDALLATATNPTIVGGQYATAQQIAEAWNTPDGKEHSSYFFKNREFGIRTYQDIDIESRLAELGQLT